MNSSWSIFPTLRTLRLRLIRQRARSSMTTCWSCFSTNRFPGISQAAVLVSNLLVRDPFHATRIDDWNPDGDRNTRVMLFARNLQLDPGDNLSAVNVNVRGSNNQLITVFPD